MVLDKNKNKKITVCKSNLGEWLVVLNNDKAMLGFSKVFGDTKEEAIRNAKRFVMANDLDYDLD